MPAQDCAGVKLFDVGNVGLKTVVKKELKPRKRKMKLKRLLIFLFWIKREQMLDLL